jgi:hypothetical protein
MIEPHSTPEDNAAAEDLIAAEFEWQPGWEYRLDT